MSYGTIVRGFHFGIVFASTLDITTFEKDMTFELEKKNEAEACVEFFKDFDYKPVRKGCKVSVSGDDKEVEKIFALFKKYVLCGI